MSDVIVIVTSVFKTVVFLNVNTSLWPTVLVPSAQILICQSLN